MDKIIAIAVGAVLALVAMFFREKAKRKDAENEAARLRTEIVLDEEKTKYEEGKKDADKAESDYRDAADAFRKQFGKSAD
jgi:hypothetical protein